jgi:hypothetical protein
MFCVMLGNEWRKYFGRGRVWTQDLTLLLRCCTTWAPPWALSYSSFFFFSHSVLCCCPGLSLEYSTPKYGLPCIWNDRCKPPCPDDWDGQFLSRLALSPSHPDLHLLSNWRSNLYYKYKPQHLDENILTKKIS